MLPETGFLFLTFEKFDVFQIENLAINNHKGELFLVVVARVASKHISAVTGLSALTCYKCCDWFKCSGLFPPTCCLHCFGAYVSIRQYTSAYVITRQHTSACAGFTASACCSSAWPDVIVPRVDLCKNTESCSDSRHVGEL